jgi:hypothetical protein
MREFSPIYVDRPNSSALRGLAPERKLCKVRFLAIVGVARNTVLLEQTELLTKVNRLIVPTRVFSIGSGVFLMALTAMWIYQKLNAVQ